MLMIEMAVVRFDPDQVANGGSSRWYLGTGPIAAARMDQRRANCEPSHLPVEAASPGVSVVATHQIRACGFSFGAKTL
jgi:hypothetical protein